MRKLRFLMELKNEVFQLREYIAKLVAAAGWHLLSMSNSCKRFLKQTKTSMRLNREGVFHEYSIDDRRDRPERRRRHTG